MKRWFRRAAPPEEVPEAETEPQAPQTQASSQQQPPQGMWSRLRQGLSRSRENIHKQLADVFTRSQIDEEMWEEVEAILIGADVGVETTTIMVDDLRERVRKESIKDPAELWQALVQEITSRIKTAPAILQADGLNVLLVVGVNGTGKTTTIAKLGRLAKNEGKNVLLAAGDTYRAAAIEQLNEWGRRTGIDVVAHQRKSDPSAVLFDAVAAARARSVELLLVDTAGRLHTYENLMQELSKMKRVAERELEGAGTVRVLLVLDATTGQNGLIQAKEFAAAVGIDAIALTKLDGTAKGGIVLAIQQSMGIPIAYIGVGEGFDDLQPFEPDLFARAFIGPELSDDEDA